MAAFVSVGAGELGGGEGLVLVFWGFDRIETLISILVFFEGFFFWQRGGGGGGGGGGGLIES